MKMNSALDVLNTLSPYVRRAWDGNMPPRWYLKERVLFDYEIVYIMEGEGWITIDGYDYSASPGDLFFIKPGITHSMKALETSGMRQPHIHFDLIYDEYSEKIDICYRPMYKIAEKEKKLFRVNQEILNALKFPNRIKLKDRYSIEKIIFSLIKVQEHQDEYSFLKSKALMIQLILKIYEDLHEKKHENKKTSHLLFETVSVVKEYILFNYRTDITLDSLALMANVSKNHLIRSFKEVFDTTPMQYLFSVRLERAKQLIEDSHNTMSEISEYLGFSSVQYFSKMFKKRTKLSPSAYQKLYSLKNNI